MGDLWVDNQVSLQMDIICRRFSVGSLFGRLNNSGTFQGFYFIESPFRGWLG